MAGHSRYSTLVGVAREGEQEAPPHPRREELFRVLLERGANPYDIQVLYNTHFSGDVLWWLRLVYEHTRATGRGADWDDPEWPMFDMGGYGTGARFLLWIAIRKNDPVLAEWVLSRGANPNAATASDPRFSKRSLYEDALLEQRTEIAELLLKFGAKRKEPALSDEEAFVDAARRHDRAAAATLLNRHPEYRRATQAIFDAATRDDVEAVRLLLDLGISPDVANAQNERAMHHAAYHNAISVLRLLIDRGAEVDARDARYDATPLGWAAHADQRNAIEVLSSRSRDVWNLSLRGYARRLRAVLNDEPALARASREDGVTLLWWLPDDESVATGGRRRLDGARCGSRGAQS